MAIQTFADRHTQALFLAGVSRRRPPEIVRRAIRKLAYLDSAVCLEDLGVPPGNRLLALSRDRKGQHAIPVNRQWRFCFRLADGDAYDVEVTDYH